MKRKKAKLELMNETFLRRTQEMKSKRGEEDEEESARNNKEIYFFLWILVLTFPLPKTFDLVLSLIKYLSGPVGTDCGCE